MNDNKEKKLVTEEDKPLPANLLGKLIGRKEPEGSSNEKEEKYPAKANMKVSEKIKEIVKTEQSENKETKKDRERISNTVKTEPLKQINISISRHHYRESQRLLTDVKLFTDEELNKNFTQGNLIELLIEIATEVYRDDPKSVEKKVLRLFKK